MLLFGLFSRPNLNRFLKFIQGTPLTSLPASSLPTGRQAVPTESGAGAGIPLSKRGDGEGEDNWNGSVLAKF
jgi:hypothetical protein